MLPAQDHAAGRHAKACLRHKPGGGKPQSQGNRTRLRDRHRSLRPHDRRTVGDKMGAGVQKRPARKHAAQHPAQSELTYSAGARQHADAGRKRGALPRGQEMTLSAFQRL